jgi:YegS/Rv2252/BmrU family lipid kinase
MPRACVILNPRAGRGRAGRHRDELLAELRRAGIEVAVSTTTAPHTAPGLAAQAVERDYETVIAVGGDGTLNEVVDGMVAAQERSGRRAKLALIPIGTDQDFVKVARGLQVNDIAGAVQQIARGRSRPIDLGRVTVETAAGPVQRCFINGLGLGIDARVTLESTRLLRLPQGYVWPAAIVRALLSYRPTWVRLRFDEYEIQGSVLLATVANGRSQGGNFRLTPDALIDDGLLDICVADTMRLDRIVRYIPRIIEGSHTRLPQVTMGRARRIQLDTADPVPVAADGEVVATATRRAMVEVLPGVLDFIG